MEIQNKTTSDTNTAGDALSILESAQESKPRILGEDKPFQITELMDEVGKKAIAEHYSKLGKKGSAKVMEKYGIKHYQKMGKKKHKRGGKHVNQARKQTGDSAGILQQTTGQEKTSNEITVEQNQNPVI